MIPRPRPPPVEVKPSLPLAVDDPGDPSEPSEALKQQALALAVTGGHASLQALYHIPQHLLLTAIDPDTHDSCLHRAAAAANIAFLSGVPGALGRHPASERLFWLLMSHQNREGDTALHSAARAGHLPAVAAVYRLFHLDDLDDDPERGPDSAEPPAEFWTWGQAADEAAPALDFVCTKNRDGRDAADVARLAGHAQVAVWLDALVDRLDPHGKRHKDGYLESVRQAALEFHRYRDA